MYTFKRSNSVKMFLLPQWKGSIVKGNNLLPLGANSFLLEKTPFQKGIGVQEHKQEVTNIISLAQNGGNLSSVLSPLKRDIMFFIQNGVVLC